MTDEDKFTQAVEQIRAEIQEEREEARRQLQRRLMTSRPKSSKLRDYFTEQREADDGDDE
jgi:hypothetical protein